MPTYQYTCTECGEPHETVQKFSDEPLSVCPACGGRLRKVFSPVGIVFKGSGFYRTDSRKSATAAAPAASSTSDSGSSNGSADKKARGIELLMALWKISDVWMESSAPGTCERNRITNELALAVNPSLVIVRVSTYTAGLSRLSSQSISAIAITFAAPISSTARYATAAPVGRRSPASHRSNAAWAAIAMC